MRIPFHSSLRCTSNHIRGFTVLTSSTKTLRKVTDIDLHKNEGRQRSTVEQPFLITDNNLLLNNSSKRFRLRFYNRTNRQGKNGGSIGSIRAATTAWQQGSTAT